MLGFPCPERSWARTGSESPTHNLSDGAKHLGGEPVKNFDLPLAEFLRKRNLLDKFRTRVAPRLKYLRSVIGDAFFTEEKKVEFGSGNSEAARDESEYVGVRHEDTGGLFIETEERHQEGTAEKGRGAVPRYRERLDNLSLERIRDHLVSIERRLLGSMTATEGEDALPRRVRPGELPPFTSLLGEGQVVTGKGGGFPGEERGDPLKIHMIPAPGEEHEFNSDLLQGVLSHLVVATGRRVADTHVILAGSALEDTIPWKPGGWKDGLARVFDAGQLLDPYLRTSIYFSKAMPSNAIYVYDPSRIIIHARELCMLKTSLLGNVVMGARSSLMHALSPHIEKRGEGGAHCLFPNTQRPIHVREGWRADMNHFAFLGVKSKEQAAIDRFRGRLRSRMPDEAGPSPRHPDPEPRRRAAVGGG